jgi:hypothetical protein
MLLGKYAFRFAWVEPKIEMMEVDFVKACAASTDVISANVSWYKNETRQSTFPPLKQLSSSFLSFPKNVSNLNSQCGVTLLRQFRGVIFLLSNT